MKTAGWYPTYVSGISNLIYLQVDWIYNYLLGCICLFSEKCSKNSRSQIYALGSFYSVNLTHIFHFTVHKAVFFSFLAECRFSHWNVNQVDLDHCSRAKQQPNLAIFRNTLDLFHGELTGEKHISSYQSNRKWRVSSSTPNQDRSCSEMCLGIVPISLSPVLASFPAPWAGRGGGISHYDGSRPGASTDGQRSLAPFSSPVCAPGI